MERLGVGILGAGFVAKFHLRAFANIRGIDVVAIYSRTLERARDAAAYAEQLGLGRPKAVDDVWDVLRDPRINAVWILTPNDTHAVYAKYVAEEARQGKGNLIGVAIEKPLARNVMEAREMLNAIEKSGLLHGYLENQVFMPSVTKGKEVLWGIGAKYSGRPYLARAAEEHAGPHNAWFWRPSISGGGVLLDMMCHSLEAARHFLYDPRKGKDSLRPRYIYGETATLKWLRKEYIEDLKKRFGIDFSKEPAEDYALAIVTYEDDEGNVSITETRTSWSFVGAGLRLSFEVLGPEYSLYVNTLQPELFTFISRNVRIPPSEEFVEKQNAEQGLMPIIPDEAIAYGYHAEDKHMVESFLKGKMPVENWYDGYLVVQLMMHAYLSAEKGVKIRFDPTQVESYVPSYARRRIE
ncbi:MAG: Gfo/Idh/MocA family oxidoreductase [Ignisphaera sp.]|nr:Gfo/Idh/MocA family oxidoreductase [Ignisphaera sp.]MCX8167840.1 Gfo/Idh/MocA family oxidoreductase [Ignisphaera sp.]MDW8085795.1 Gfo/Idh/MocA family oxidoreductase [Ignisphaera sp.]